MKETYWGVVDEDGSIVCDPIGPILSHTREPMREAVRRSKVRYPDWKIKVKKVRLEIVE